MGYVVHTMASAPEAARPVLTEVEATFGLIPNIAGAMANSPELLKAFLGLFRAVHSGSLTERDIQVVLLTNAVTNASAWAVAFHTMLALQEGVAAADVAAIRAGRLPEDGRGAALSSFARGMILRRGHGGAEAVAALAAGGVSEAQGLEVLAVIAASVMTNYTGSLVQPPLEAFLQAHRWAGVDG